MVRFTAIYDITKPDFSHFKELLKEHLRIKKQTPTAKASLLALHRVTDFFNNQQRGVSTLEELEPAQAWYHARDADIRQIWPAFYTLQQRVIEPYTLSFSAPFTTPAATKTTLCLNLQSHYARALHAAKKAIDNSADNTMLYDAIIDQRDELRSYSAIGMLLTSEDTLEQKELGVIGALTYHLLDATEKMTRFYTDFIGTCLGQISTPKEILINDKPSGFHVTLCASDVKDILSEKSAKDMLERKDSLSLPYENDVQRIANQYL